MTVLTQAALKYARLGWAVFPVTGKVPAIRRGRGLHDATSDSDAVLSLFSRAPDADGVAVNCGASGLVVLDVDRKAGVDGAEELASAGLPWLDLPGPRALTRHGGVHVYLTGALASRTGVLPGVDIKAAGGYVVAPPSPGYVWEVDQSPDDVAPGIVPEWLSRLCKGRQGTKLLWQGAVVDFIREGSRNETAASIAGHLLKRHVDVDLAALLVVAWNRAFCAPPMAEEEALGVVRSIARRRGR